MRNEFAHRLSQVFTTGFFVTLSDAVLKGTGLLLAACLLQLLLRRRAAALRHAIWTTTLGLLISLPVLSAALPGWRVLPDWLRTDWDDQPVVPGTTVVGTSVSPALSVSPGIENGGPAEIAQSGFIDPAGGETLSAHSMSTTSADQTRPESMNAGQAPVEVAAHPARGAAIRSGILAAWLLGLGACVLRMVLSGWALCRCRWRANQVVTSLLSQEFFQLGSELGLHRLPRLLLGEDRAMPMAWGVLRSCVLVPRDIEHWPASQRRAVLLHELGHIVRRDPLWQVLVQAALAVYWFHPLVWLAAWRVHVERERACDDLVLNRGIAAPDYARHLLDVVSGGRLRRIGPAVGVAMASSRKLEGRVRSIMDGRCDRRPLTARVLAVSVAACLAVGVPLAMMRAAPPEKAQKSSSSQRTPQAEKTNADGAPVVDKSDDAGNYVVPIDVSGRALDADGKPIAGAVIFLGSQAADYKRISETTTDEQGRYVFLQIPLPIERATTNNGRDVGAFEVFGFADGYAIAWRPKKEFFPDPKAVDRNVVIEGEQDLPRQFAAGDKIELDLTFERPVSLSGRIVDDRGQPIPETDLDIRYADTEWDRPDYNIFKFRGALQALNERETVPPEFKRRKTDADGRFTFTGLRPDCRYWVFVRAPGSSLKRIWVVTHPGKMQDEIGLPIYGDGMELTFATPIDVPVRVVYDDTGEPAPRVFVNLWRVDASAAQVSDREGRATLRVPPGDYTLHLSPAHHTPYLETDHDFQVTADSSERPSVARLRRGAVVEVSVVDSSTGAGLPNVDLWCEKEYDLPDGRPPRRQREVHEFRSFEAETRIAHVNRPRTDADGHLWAVFEPGKHRIGVGLQSFPEGYGVIESDGLDVDCKAGETVNVTFHMRRR